MINRNLKAIAAAALIGASTFMLPGTAEAGHGDAVGAGLLGLGIGAIIGSALTPQTVYVTPPPPPPPYYYAPYAPAAYGPPPWTPAWYSYCASRYRSFNPNTGYFIGYDGIPRFCQ